MTKTNNVKNQPMKNSFLLPALALLLSLASCDGRKTISGNELAAGFAETPDSIQTSVYWYWISNHISADGVRRDLESMKRIGIDRAFIGNIGLKDSESGEGPVKFYSEAWWEVMHTALKTATELGIDIGIFNCPGWSQSGGPWVEPQQSMRYLANTSTRITGGQLVETDLPRPAGERSADFQDVKVIAFPAIDGRTLTPADTEITTTPSVPHPEQLIDGDPDTSVELLPAGSQSREVTLEFTTDRPFTLRSLKLRVTEAPVDCPARLEAELDGTLHTLAEFPVTRFNPALHVGFDPYAPIVISVPATASTRFRLVSTDATPGFGLREAELSSLPTVERYPEKTLAKMYQTPLPYWHEYMWRIQPATDDQSLVIRPGDILDISDCLEGDRLTWNAPAGEWTVLRTGMLPTGVVNSPARPEAEGLETDKMSKQHIEAHFEAFLGEIYRRIPAEDRKCWKVVVEDSYETGGQNFTDGFLEAFQTRYGYDPVPFLPVYAGTVVQSEEVSDRFLWDMRRLAADKLAYAHIGGLREIAHKYGLTLWLENYGHWGYPGEFLQYGGQSDEVGGEFWGEGSLGDIENRAASSCAHIYGKRKVSAESYTSAGNDFGRYPAMVKPRGDRFFSEGINNTLLHVYISQPGDELPGMNAWFGTEFNRNNTWFSHIDLFTDYLKRVNYMLQQGLNVADVAYFIGEDAPKMTGVTDPALPRGYQYDYINGEVLLERAPVKDGLWTLPHGTQYRILVLPKLKTMRPELLAKLQALVREGGVLLGPAPQRSPSLEGYPDADARVRRMAAELWGGVDGKAVKAARYGKGAVLDGMTMEEALAYVQCLPDCEVGADVPVLFGHRDAGDVQIYFLTNQSDARIAFPCTLRVTGSVPEAWDAVTGAIRPLPEFEDDGRRTTLPMVLEPNQSLFVVLRADGANAVHRDGTANFPTPVRVKTLDGPWTLTFQEGRRGPAEPVVADELKDLRLSDDESVRYFSGSVRYETTFDLRGKEKSGRLYVNTGQVGVMAKVYVNGKYAGGVWTAPYRVDVTDFVRKGKNTLVIDVVNTWVNRLVGDSRLPEDQRETWTLNNPWRPDSQLQPSGLFNPVVIERMIAR